MPRPKGSKNKSKDKKTDSVRISLALGSHVYEGVGNSFEEAFDSMSRPFKVVSKGTLVVSKGDKKRILPLQPSAVKQLFFPVARLMVIKKLSFGL